MRLTSLLLLLLSIAPVMGLQAPRQGRPPATRVLTTPRILAFGDSITEGITIHDDRRFEAIRGYPARLQALLAARYPGQPVRVDNAGLGGELAVDGVRRFETLIAGGYDLVVVLEGVNDLNNRIPPEQIQAALRSMASTAKRHGTKVLLCTLTPVIGDKVTKRYKGPRAAQIEPVNRLIRALAKEEGTGLADLAGAFGPAPSRYLCIDGLHPNAAGYQRIAQAVRLAVSARFEKRESRSGAGPAAGLSRAVP